MDYKSIGVRLTKFIKENAKRRKNAERGGVALSAAV
jgi:hypothetical protein